MSARIEHSGRAIRDPAVLLWTVAGLCWTATVLLTALGGAKLANHDHIMEHSTLPWLTKIAAFLLIWTVMVGAMMLPTTVRMARLVAVVSARAPNPTPARVALALSYLAVCGRIRTRRADLRPGRPLQRGSLGLATRELRADSGRDARDRQHHRAGQNRAKSRTVCHHCSLLFGRPPKGNERVSGGVPGTAGTTLERKAGVPVRGHRVPLSIYT